MWSTFGQMSEPVVVMVVVGRLVGCWVGWLLGWLLVGWLVVVGWWGSDKTLNDDVFFHTAAAVYLIRVADAGSQTPGVPATPSPRRPTPVGNRGPSVGLDVRVDGVRKMSHF